MRRRGVARVARVAAVARVDGLGAVEAAGRVERSRVWLVSAGAAPELLELEVVGGISLEL